MKRCNTMRALWTASALLAIGACWYVQHHFERRIARAQTSVESLYAMTSANERTVREAGRLRAARNAAEADLKRFGAGASLPSATAAVLEALERQARAHRATVAAVAPAAVTTSIRTPGLLAVPVTLRVRGQFRDLLAFLIDVSERTPLLEIRRTQLAPSGKRRTRVEPMLDAVIDAMMYRFTPRAHEGKSDASDR